MDIEIVKADGSTETWRNVRASFTNKNSETTSAQNYIEFVPRTGPDKGKTINLSLHAYSVAKIRESDGIMKVYDNFVEVRILRSGKGRSLP